MSRTRAIILLVFVFSSVFLLWSPKISVAQSADCPPDPATGQPRVCLKNPLAVINVNRPGDLVKKAFIGFAMILASLAVAFTVFSGFKLVIASNEESISKARAGLTWSVGGLAVSLLAFTVISGVAKFLGFNPGQVNLTSDQIANPILLPGGRLTSSDFLSVTNYVMVNFLGLLGFVTIAMMIYYGFKYITAAGNEETLEQAKTGLRWSIFGFVVTVLAFSVITIVREYLLKGPPA